MFSRKPTLRVPRRPASLTFAHIRVRSAHVGATLCATLAPDFPAPPGDSAINLQEKTAGAYPWRLPSTSNIASVEEPIAPITSKHLPHGNSDRASACAWHATKASPRPDCGQVSRLCREDIEQEPPKRIMWWRALAAAKFQNAASRSASWSEAAAMARGTRRRRTVIRCPNKSMHCWTQAGRGVDQMLLQGSRQGRCSFSYM